MAEPVATAFQAVAYGTRPKTRRGKATDFRFVSAFDTNGILHHIGTRGGTAAYRNPHELGEVVSSGSSFGNGGPSAKRFVEHKHESRTFNFTCNAPQSWLAVDLGEGRSLVVDHYCLRSDLNNRHKLRNWELQGSLNGQTWQTLRAHQGDESLASQSMSTAAWPVNAGAQAFRHFRILQTGANSSGNHFLKCTGIELYGRANFQPHA